MSVTFFLGGEAPLVMGLRVAKRHYCSLCHTQIRPWRKGASSEYVIMLEPSYQIGKYS